MRPEHRFRGAMAEDYRLVSTALPHFEKLQEAVGRAVAEHPNASSGTIHAIEIGCGDGVTSSSILHARDDLTLITVDNEPEMVSQARTNLRELVDAGRCEIVIDDALSFLESREAKSADVVASAMTLHNLEAEYRHAVHAEIHRVLRPGGLLINADKYTPQDDAERFRCLALAIERFFDAFVPLGKLDLLEDWVRHHLADQGPDRVMRQEEAIAELTAIGFRDVRILQRHNMEAVLEAHA